jgi:hypothetical protein
LIRTTIKTAKSPDALKKHPGFFDGRSGPERSGPLFSS